MRRFTLLLATLSMLAGCSMGTDMAAATSGISTFHNQLNAADFNGIYAGSGPELRQAISQSGFVQFLSAVHRKLGPFVSGKQTGWNDTVNLNGHFVTLNDAAQYTRGTATENFVFKLAGKNASLIGCHINSTALIVN